MSLGLDGQYNGLATFALILSLTITSLLSLFWLGLGMADVTHNCENINISDMLYLLVLCQFITS